MKKQNGITNQNKISANVVGSGPVSAHGITLIALIISIIIMLILAGVVLNLTIGERGIFNTASDASRKYIIEEMREELNLALSDLQLEKSGKATLDDVTQDWADGTKLKEYQTQITEEAGIEGKIATMHKNGITGRFIIGGNLKITEDEITKPTPPKKQYKIGANIGEGLTLDNNSTTVTEDSKYEANIKAGLEYIIDSLTVKMGGQVVTTGGNNIVDVVTGKIKIEKVTGDIEITATSAKIGVTISEIIIGSTETATTSVADNSQAKGTKLYINFTATINGQAATITYKENETKPFPFEVTQNGIYTFILTITENGKIIRKEYDVKVNKYQAPVGIVKYDAGEWTEEEIQQLQSQKLYDININRTVTANYKLVDNDSVNLTFGGFTYKGDTLNSTSINNERVITSRNKSIAPQSGWGSPKYEGWQLMKTETKQNASGDIIKNNDGTDRIYVKSIIHAGCPENFVFHYGVDYTVVYQAHRGDFILSSGLRNTGYSTLWNSRYEDKSKKVGYV